MREKQTRLDIPDDILNLLNVSDRDREVYKLWANGMTYEAIGKRYLVTRERIRQRVVKVQSRYNDYIMLIEEPTRIKYFGLSIRAYNALSRAGYKTADEVRKLSKEDLLMIRNIGEKVANEIINTFA